jgi:hypothetical protein
MLATSGTHSLQQATAMMQATTATPRAAEMPKTVLTPTRDIRDIIYSIFLAIGSDTVSTGLQ